AGRVGRPGGDRPRRSHFQPRPGDRGCRRTRAGGCRRGEDGDHHRPPTLDRGAGGPRGRDGRGPGRRGRLARGARRAGRALRPFVGVVAGRRGGEQRVTAQRPSLTQKPFPSGSRSTLHVSVNGPIAWLLVSTKVAPSPTSRSIAASRWST